MKAYKFIKAPGFSADELMRLRAHVDEAITDPDYSVVVSYEVNWVENTFVDENGDRWWVESYPVNAL